MARTLPPLPDTERLTLHFLTEADAEFNLALMNSPGFLRYIGDRGVRTLEQSALYLLNRPIKSYTDHGLGMYLVRRKSDGVALGMAGLVRRPELDAPDVGFAFLPEHEGKGYAFEASRAVLEYGRTALGITRVLAITLPENTRSVALCKRLGMEFSHETKFSEEVLSVYARDL